MKSIEEMKAEVQRMLEELNARENSPPVYVTCKNEAGEDEQMLLEEFLEFEFAEPSANPRSYSPIELKRQKFKAFVERQFELRAQGHKDRKAKKDRCAFVIENGKTVMELRYGMAPLKAKGRIVVPPDEQAFKNRLIRAIDKGEFDDALELTAKRTPKKDKKVQKEAETQVGAE